jgi:hypothetical protein
MMRTLMAVTILICLFGSSAEAHVIPIITTIATIIITSTTTITIQNGRHQHYAGRPRAWCVVHALAGRQRSRTIL